MPTTTLTRPLRVLLVEDDPADAAMTRIGFETAGIPCDIEVVRDGLEAMSFLRRTGRFREATRPDLVLLDLGLPRKTGRDVLVRIKTDPELDTLPVVILTGSESLKDIAGVYDFHASCYLTKPARPRDRATLARFLLNLWLQEGEVRLVD
jgi:two-component system, chemotaxis family, response regulator Rcp1